MRKEKILSVIYDVKPDYIDRHVEYGDDKIIVYDKKGDRITLAEHKKLYPYQLLNDVRFTIETTKRTFIFVIESGYVWNGADIPSIL
ncbi:MAG: hypothetical protein J6Q89_05530, partial [Clostridia bacterium]|nr:hypothetical protein [Clostridia bacterium]